MSSTDRRSAYAADVTYLTAKEAGFDFLRDSLRCAQGASVLGPLHCAIVDEADSILIDEARIPLVIAGTSVESANIPEGLLFAMAELVRKLERGIDFEFDDYLRNIHLTEQGERRTEETLCCGNLYEERNFDTQARLSLALHAQHFLKIDEDYIVRNGKIELVDEFTGRVAEARRWPDGLQRAVEAKEGISCMLSGNILNSMTLQHFARLYPKLSGMTATAQTAEEELRRFYNMAVVVIPPHSKCIRVDLPDAIYASHEAKINALVRKIAFVHASGRPILVGTRTIRESEELGRNLAGLGIRCSVLNAWQDAREASIVAEAGALGAVTIATNMAGRGTDIRLGGAQGSSKQAVADLGGLFVIATNKHESLRVDNQLRGRAGRQGDPGSTQFFVSLQDDLFVRYRLADLLPRRLIRPDATGYIDNKFVRSEIGRLQRIIEGQNTEIKLTLYRYSVLLEKQRVIAFDKRDHLLAGNNSYNLVNRLDPTVAHRLAEMCGADGAREQCRIMSLQCFDRLWAQHLAVASELREGIHLRRLGGQDPLYEFQKLIIDLFDTMLGSLDAAILAECRSIALGDRSFNSRNHVPSATWTYLINDNPFDPMLEIQLKGNVGLSAWAGLLWPLTALYFVAKRLSQKRSERV
jgi:preprotein translocase subunit SecA